MQRRPLKTLVRKVDQTVFNLIKRGIERFKRTLGEVV